MSEEEGKNTSLTTGPAAARPGGRRLDDASCCARPLERKEACARVCVCVCVCMHSLQQDLLDWYVS